MDYIPYSKLEVCKVLNSLLLEKDNLCTKGTIIFDRIITFISLLEDKTWPHWRPTPLTL